ncbi:MAG: VF530 family DNA-binding protein [Oceanisphaera sp.]
MTEQPNNPLHGITLKALLTELVDRLGWQELALRVNINCFKSNPSIKSSLTFLRRTPWARAEVEAVYLELKSNVEL